MTEYQNNNFVEQKAEPSITSFEDLQRYSRGQIVELPSFADGQPLVARMRRPSLMALAKTGQIPNALLSSANELFAGGSSSFDADKTEMLADILGICEVIAEASLIEPTYADIKAAGLELSDDQMMAIFSYSQNGIDALKSFR